MGGAKALRSLLGADAMVIAPGAYDGLTAKLVAQAGFPAVYMTGAGTSVSQGYPDFGLLTMSEMVENAARIVRAVDVPVIADADTGYGNELNAFRTVQEYEGRGVAAIHIEDQVAAKRCGHRPGKAIVPKDEMVDRIKAAVDARDDKDFVIMARTDAIAVEGIGPAIERAVACVEAGADMIFPEAIYTLEQYREFKNAVKVPILANITEFGQTPLFTTDELKSAGVDIVLYCCGAYRAMNKAALNFYQTVRRDGTQKAVVPSMQTREELYDFLGYHAYEQKLDALFAGGKADE